MTMSKSLWTRVSIVPLGAICMFLSASAEAAPNPRDPNKLERITSPEGGFTVLMPCGAAQTTRTLTTSHGPVTEHALQYSTGSEQYEVVYADFQDTPDESLESFTNLVVAKNKILTNIDITKNGHRGKLITLVTEDGKYAGATFFSFGSRIVLAAYSSADPAGLLRHGDAFLESLQLTR